MAADPAPDEPLTVTVTVTQDGDYAAAGTTGERTVTIPTTGSASHTVATNDDDADEEDGSITLTLKAGDDYTVSSDNGEASVAVADNDDAAQRQSCLTTDTGLLAEVEAKTKDPWNGARPDLVETFTRAYNTMNGTDTYTVADIKARPDRQTPNWQGDGPNELWQKIYKELDRLQDCRDQAETTTPATPEVSVTAGAGITEGGTASFTVTASPAPAAPLTVTVTVTQTGDYGATTGTKTVIIPTGGSKTHTVATVNDNADEANGSVKVTVNAGQGYTISTNQGTATVTVADDDDPPPATPEVSVTAGAGITEGGTASFTVTASPAPAAPLTVTVTVTQTGDYGATTGTKTVIIPTGGSKTHTVATVNDNADEANGSVKVTVNAGQGYTISTNQGTATVTVTDDDDPPPATPPAARPTVSVEPASASEGGELVFRVTLSEATDETVWVSWYTYTNNDRDKRSARADVDYELWGGTIKIAAGQTSGTGRVWLLQDNLKEGPEAFDVWLLPNVRGADIAVQRAVMTIIDDD